MTENTISQAIHIGECEVLSSGSLIIPESKVVEFTFDNLKFRIVFEIEKDNNGNYTPGHISYDVEKDETSNSEFLNICMYNQTRAFFSSSKSMIHVATLHGRKLYLKFCINSINSQDNSDIEDKIFFYTWLLDKTIFTI